MKEDRRGEKKVKKMEILETEKNKHVFSEQKSRTSCRTRHLQEVDPALDVVALAPDNSDGEFYRGTTRVTMVIFAVVRSSSYQSRRTGKGHDKGNTYSGARSATGPHGQHAPTFTNAEAATAASGEGR